MIRIIDPQTAKNTILRRLPADEAGYPPALLDSIAAAFGEALTPDQAVRRILQDVRVGGDESLRRWSERLDGVRLDDFRLPQNSLHAALKGLPKDQRRALDLAASRIEDFHRRQPLTSWLTQEMGGTLGQLVRPIRRVGLYVPGGSAPLPSSVLMSAIPARVAGVPEIVVATPPGRPDCTVSPVILAACALAGVDEVYRIGGAQAIAALAYGSASIAAVDKICGPGNLFVTLAKQQVYGVVGIDGLAGPTETMVIADDSAKPSWVAADLLAQAEHDLLAAAILLTPSKRLAQAVQAEIARSLSGEAEDAPGRVEIIRAALTSQGGIVLTPDLDEAFDLANAYAPEHLELALAEPWRWVEKVCAAGGVFVGEHSFEVLGDYVAGPSHVMPTGGSARFASPLNVWDFVRLISLVAVSPESAPPLAEAAACIARLEGLDAHARAAEIRLE